MKNSATLKKIAEHLSMSISTVSRALKDHPDVSAETKRRVKELSEMLDYEPNAFAVNLRKRHSNIFAIIVPEISNFFYHAFIQAVEEEARMLGFSIITLQSMDDTDIEKANLKLCRYNHVAGIFLALSRQTNSYEHFLKMEEMDIPIVFFDKVPESGNFCTVSISDVEAGILAAEKLLRPERPILAVMGNNQMSITHRREEGFKKGLQHAPEGQSLEFLYAGSEAEAFQLVKKYFSEERPPLSIFCMSDEILCGVMRCLYQLRIAIPEKVSLLALSNGFLPRMFYPEVAYVETNGYSLGKLSFAKMQELRHGKLYAKDNFLPCHFHPGGSL